MTTKTNETNKIFKNLDKFPITDGSKKIDDGILEIIGHYTFDELEEDHAKAKDSDNDRKEAILEYVLDRMVYSRMYIDMIMVSTYNNSASFSVSMKSGYTLQTSIEDMKRAIKAGINPRLGKLNLETMEIE